VAVWAPAPGPAAGILVAAFADPAAAVVGGRFGSGARKTWQGTAAAAVVALAVLVALGLPREAVLAGTVVGTLLERWPGALNDNLLVAPAVAAVVRMLA
jgi:dolichol kinase